MPNSPGRKAYPSIIHAHQPTYEELFYRQVTHRKSFSSNFYYPKPRRTMGETAKRESTKPTNQKTHSKLENSPSRPLTSIKYTSNSRPISPTKKPKGENFREVRNIEFGNRTEEIIVETRFGVPMIVQEKPYYLHWQKTLERLSPVKKKEPKPDLSHGHHFVSPFDKYQQAKSPNRHKVQEEKELDIITGQPYHITLKNLFPKDINPTRKGYPTINIHKIKQNKIK